MTPTATRTGIPTGLVEQVLALTPEQRDELLELAELADLPADTRTPEEWKEEIARRTADVQAGRSVLLTREQAEAEIREAMRKLGVEL